MQQTLGRGVADVALAAGDVRHTMKLFICQADVEVQAQRLGDPRDDGLTRSATVSPAQQLADQPAVSDGRITVAFARRPPRGFGRQGVDHGLPVIKGFGGQQLAQCRQTGLMAKQLTQGHGFFAGRRELRPIAGHRGVQLQLAFGNQLQRGHGGEGLGAGEEVGNGVAVPGLGAILVGGAGPEVEHGFATDLDAQRRATFLGIVEQRRECLTHCLELKLVMTLNLHPQLPG
ncbi:hypothetical protein D3C87_1136110 [compost metagenome]